MTSTMRQLQTKRESFTEAVASTAIGLAIGTVVWVGIGVPVGKSLLGIFLMTFASAGRQYFVRRWHESKYSR